MEKRRSIVGAMISDQNTVGAAAGIVLDPVQKQETKSKRVQVLMKPSTYALVKSKCEHEGRTVNDCINQLLEKWVEV